jgi:hypothetical protein
MRGPCASVGVDPEVGAIVARPAHTGCSKGRAGVLISNNCYLYRMHNKNVSDEFVKMQ